MQTSVVTHDDGGAVDVVAAPETPPGEPPQPATMRGHLAYLDTLQGDVEYAGSGSEGWTKAAAGIPLGTVRDLGANRVLAGEALGRGTSLVFGQAEWTDYVLELRVWFDATPPILALIVRHDPVTGKNYQLELAPGGTRLVRSLSNREDDPKRLRSIRLDPTPRTWHILRAVCRGEQIELWMDGQLAIRSNESLSPRGMCKLFLRGGPVYVDDVTVKTIAPDRTR